MALFHVATITPTKEQLLADWVPNQSWSPDGGQSVDVIGAYRFDDPAGEVGMESFLVQVGDAVLHVPLTYREAPLDGADDALICTMEHSALGRRWIYDGLRDAALVTMMAAVAMTGQGEALGMASHEGRWFVAPSNVRIHGGGWSLKRVPVDGFTTDDPTAAVVAFRNERFSLDVHRRPPAGSKPPIGLVATWTDHPDPVVLAEVRTLRE